MYNNSPGQIYGFNKVTVCQFRFFEIFMILTMLFLSICFLLLCKIDPREHYFGFFFVLNTKKCNWKTLSFDLLFLLLYKEIKCTLNAVTCPSHCPFKVKHFLEDIYGWILSF